MFESQLRGVACVTSDKAPLHLGLSPSSRGQYPPFVLTKGHEGPVCSPAPGAGQALLSGATADHSWGPRAGPAALTPAPGPQEQS